MKQKAPRRYSPAVATLLMVIGVPMGMGLLCFLFHLTDPWPYYLPQGLIAGAAVVWGALIKKWCRP